MYGLAGSTATGLIRSRCGAALKYQGDRTSITTMMSLFVVDHDPRWTLNPHRSRGFESNPPGPGAVWRQRRQRRRCNGHHLVYRNGLDAVGISFDTAPAMR